MSALLDSHEFWIAAAIIAVFFYWLGRSHGGETPSERADRIATARMQAASALKQMPQDKRAEIDDLIRGKQMIAAIKLIRSSTGLDLKGAKDAADQRRSELGGSV
ncbi:MAG: hypothetical protein WAW96_13875 [Alphaproteobacteria bacterium]